MKVNSIDCRIISRNIYFVVVRMARDQYWDVIKGLGIIAVVVGHTGGPLGPYIYMYHLALFFFVAGFFYKEKYSIDPFAYFAGRLRNLWLPMVKYSMFFTLLNNFLLDINIYTTNKTQGYLTSWYFNQDGFIIMMKNTLIMQSIALIAGAMWFIIPLLVSLTIFCIIRHVSTNYLGEKREFMACIMVFGCFILGLHMIENKIPMEYHIDIALIATPIIYGGFTAKMLWDRIPLKWYLGLVSLSIIILIHKTTGATIDFYYRSIIGPKWFLLASFAGIYGNLVLGKLLLKIPKLNTAIAYIGKKSFHLMALHLLTYKIVSLYYVLRHNLSYSEIAKFPVISSKLWILYSIAGIVGPLLVTLMYDYYIARYKNYKTKTISA